MAEAFSVAVTRLAVNSPPSFLSLAQTLCPQEERGEYDGDDWRLIFHTHIFSRICRFCAETYEKAQEEQEKMTAREI